MLKSWRIKWPRHVSARVRSLYGNMILNVKVKDYFAIIAGVGKMILKRDFKDRFCGCGLCSYDSG
jgi:hypothetical protein